MAKNMEAFLPEIQRLVKVNRETTQARKKLSDLEKEQKALRSSLFKTLGRSKVGIAGLFVIEKVTGTRRTVTLERVEKFAPHLADVLIEEKATETVKITIAEK